MTPIKRTLGTAGAAVLLAATLSACGGGAPTDASKDDFCNDVHNAEPDLSGLDPDSSPEEQAEVIKEEFDKITERAEEVGTPEDIPDDAREGFEIVLDISQDVDEDDIAKAIEDQDEDFLEPDGDDKEKVDAYNEWAGEYCG